MSALPDPRRYGAGGSANPLLALADRDRAELIGVLRELAVARCDVEIADALAEASSQAVYARVWRALCAAIEKPPSDESLTPRIFAIPWVIVCSGTAAATVSCVLSDVAQLARILEQHGVFGASRNLGLSNALCAVDALEAFSPSEVVHGWENARFREVAPAPISVLRGVEEVHVRFLPGAAIAPAHAPDIVETGANVGAWGTPALRAMAVQLATPGAQILPMPRPPAGLYSAAYAGRRAGVEAALNLFMSNVVRRFRMTVGDPSLTISSHEGNELRITLWSVFDEAMVEGFRWPLHPADDLGDIERTIAMLAEEVRLPTPIVADGVFADRTSTGAVLFPH